MRDGVLAARILHLVVDRGAELLDIVVLLVGVVEDVRTCAHTISDGLILAEALDGAAIVGPEAALSVANPGFRADDAHAEVGERVDDLDAESSVDRDLCVSLVAESAPNNDVGTALLLNVDGLGNVIRVVLAVAVENDEMVGLPFCCFSESSVQSPTIALVLVVFDDRRTGTVCLGCGLVGTRVINHDHVICVSTGPLNDVRNGFGFVIRGNCHEDRRFERILLRDCVDEEGFAVEGLNAAFDRNGGGAIGWDDDTRGIVRIGVRCEVVSKLLACWIVDGRFEDRRSECLGSPSDHRIYVG